MGYFVITTQVMELTEVTHILQNLSPLPPGVLLFIISKTSCPLGIHSKTSCS